MYDSTQSDGTGTGIKYLDIASQSKVFLFPNPAVNNNFRVQASNIISSVEIINVLGQSIFKEENELVRGDMFVELSSQDKGLLLVKVTFEDNTSQVKKILVQ